VKQKTIAIDIDDVLSAQAEGLLAFSNERWGHNLTLDDYTEEFAVLWSVSVPEAIERVKELMASGAHGRYRSHTHALPILAGLATRYKLIAVTSRRRLLKAETEEWLERHFPGIFQEVHYAGIWDDDRKVADAVNATKAEVCRELGAEYLIDDQLKHCAGAAAAGIKAVLFGVYPWNRQADLPPGVTRARDWDEVEDYFNAQG
jgi:uncharacterized HAD superfamily protein